MAVTNQLEIDIKAKSQKATDSLDALISKLNEVNTALNSLNTAKITQMSSSIKGLKGVHIKASNGGGTGGIVKENDRAKSSFERLLNSVTNADKGFRGLRGTMLKLSATWGMFYASMYPFIRLFQFMGKEVEHSMDYVETFNYFKVTMNKIGHDAGEEFTDSFLSQIKSLDKKMTGFKIGKNGELIDADVKNLGIDPNVMMQFQAQIGAVTNSVGLLGDTSVVTQKAMSMLSADLSSLKNEDLQSVMKNLQSGLIGQSRALYKYGIDITQATLKQYAYEHGVTKSVSAMSQSEKMQLRLLAILDQSKVAWGDQANSIMTVANQYRIMKQQISNLGRTIGNLFLPVVKTILPYLNAFIIALRKVFDMLGGHIYGSDWKKDLMEGVSEGNFDGIIEGAEDSEDALDGATKAAKKFKQATMGFDELNIINPNTASGSGSGKVGGGGIDLSDDIADAFEDYEKVWNDAFEKMNNKAEEIADRIFNYFKNKDWRGLGVYFSQGISRGLESIDWETAKNGATELGKALAEFNNGLINPRLFWDLGESIAEGLNVGFSFLNSWGENFDWSNLGTSLSEGARAFFTKWDAGLTSETFSTFAKGFLEGITSFLTNSMNKDTFKEVGKDIVDLICGFDWLGAEWDLVKFFDALGKALVDFPKDLAEGFWEELLNKIFNPSGNSKISEKIDKIVKSMNLGDKVKKSILSVFPQLTIPLTMAVDMKSFGDAIIDAKEKIDDFKNKWDTTIDQFQNTDFATKIGIAWDVFVTWWDQNGALTWINNHVKIHFNEETWNNIGSGIKDGLSKAWNNFVEFFRALIPDWLENDVKPNFDEGVWTFDGIKKGLKKSFQAALNGVKTLWNSFAEWINEHLTWKIDPVVIAGKTIFDGADIQLAHLPKFNIPQYAIGGFPEDGLFMANHNELVGQFSNGQTAVANNEQIIEGIRSGVATAVAQTLAPYLREIADNTGNTATNTDTIARKPVQSLSDRDIARANNRGMRSMGLQLRTS